MCTHEASRGQQYSDVVERWTLDDLDDWNIVLDAIDSSRARAMKAHRQKTGH